MMKRDLIIGLGTGIVVGLVAAINLVSGPTMPKVAAQEAKGASSALSRYQILTWTNPNYAHTGAPRLGYFGAYVIDSTTGQVWISTNGAKLESLGKAE
jgi:xanthosine utilization system XapX-like protein